MPSSTKPPPEVMAPEGGLISPQPKEPSISGPGVEEVGLPSLPKAPAPFKELPVTAEQMSPPSR